jgi:hypothetical protein
MKVTGTCHCRMIAYEEGRPRLTSRRPRAGTSVLTAFAPTVARQFFSTSPDPSPSTYGLRVGGIDQRAQFAPPARQIWCRSALPWSMDLRAVTVSERG